jgi:hypothetical protein
MYGGEDSQRDPVDRGKAVPPGPNETEDLESVLLEDPNLKHIATTYKPISSVGLTSAASGTIGKV